jgi:hypothetical protein
MAVKEKEEVELEPVGPGADEEDEIIRDTDGEDVHAGEDEDTDRDVRASADDDEREGHAEDDDEADPDRVKIRQRRKDERRTKKEQLKRERRELNFLRQRNDTLERRQSEFDARQTNTEVMAIDGRIQALEGDIRKADEIYAEAISKGDGQSAAEAQKIRDDLRDGLQAYKNTRQGTIAAARERLTPKQNGPDPEIQSRAQDWVADNPWYDPKMGNEDSEIAKAIESRLAREKGPAAAKTDEYWDEFNRRLKKRLPHVFKNGRDRNDDRDDDSDEERGGNREQEDDKPVRRGGPRFTSGGRERPLKKGEVFVSKERRQAMEEAGVWDDPETRNRYLKQYQKYDTEARRNRH